MKFFCWSTGQSYGTCKCTTSFWHSSVSKCTLCSQLTADGYSKPACVHNCPGGARFYGDLEDPESDVSKELAKYDDECIHQLPAPDGEAPLTRYILSPKYASWKENL